MNYVTDELFFPTNLTINMANKEFFQHVIDSLDECILVLDINKKILLTNQAFQDKLEVSGRHFLHSNTCHELFSDRTFSCNSHHNHCPFNEVMQSKKPTRTIHQYDDDNGKLKYLELSITPLYDDNKNIYGYVESRRDMSEHIKLQANLKEKEKALYDLAHNDILTGMPNRRLFLKRLEHAIVNAHRNQTKLAVLFIDLDNFKQINDGLGHHVGDEVLTIAAKRLQQIIRQSDTVARLGGDEFVILMESLKEPDNAEILANKIIKKQSHAIKLKNHEVYMKSSIGISIYPEHGVTAETLLQNADVAMYQSKQLGRNTFYFYSSELSKFSYNRMLLENDLNQAVKKNQLIIYYQPQVNLNTTQLTGMEALVRWQHPTEGLLLPNKFIPLAEKSSLIEEIGEWILTSVCKQIVLWKKAGKKPGRVAVNLAGKQLFDNNLIDKIKIIFSQTGCPPEALEFKITEGFIAQLSDQ